MNEMTQITVPRTSAVKAAEIVRMIMRETPLPAVRVAGRALLRDIERLDAAGEL